MSGQDSAGSRRIRVLIADDQALIRRGMSLMIRMEADMEVVGQAGDGQEAIELAQSLQPDVVLMDLHMPRKGGVAATREIMHALPDTRVLVLTTLAADEMVFDAVRAGAQAYLLKDASEQELLETIRGLMRGESWLTPQIARKVMDQFRRLSSAGAPPAGEPARGGDVGVAIGTGRARQAADGGDRGQAGSAAAGSGAAAAPARGARGSGAAFDAPATDELTPKEAQILALIVEGRSNRQIAETVFLAEGTVKNYVSRIMEKLHASTRTELAVKSLRQKLG